MNKKFSVLNTDEAVRVVGGTSMEDTAREIGRLVGHLVGTIQKLFDKIGELRVSASF